ncbi:MAG: DUF429 domain-containing protein, partial [Nitrospiraceae bacterium]
WSISPHSAALARPLILLSAIIPPFKRGVVSKRSPFIVVGIDLAGSPRRPTGVCVLRGLKSHTHIAFSDEEILHAVQQAQPDLVPIDAPLSLPEGRRTIHDRSGEHLRTCDRALLRRGIRFFPVTLGPMRMLTERGLALKAKIQAMGYRVIECYPGAAQDVWGIPRQHRDRKGLLAGLKNLGVNGLTKAATSDELDAATAALVGRWFLLDRGEMLGGKHGILIPSGGSLKRAPS